MSKVRFPIIVMVVALLALIPGCGAGTNRVLDSINISPNTAAGATASYVATGNYNAPPMTVSPQSVSWYIMGPGIDPPPAVYSLAVTPYTGQRCSQFQTTTAETYTVIAVAPVDPAATNFGTIPSQVFEDLVIGRTATAEAGFVSATATLSCP
jgi:hypothetical protein